MGRAKRIWYLSPMRAAKVQASLRIRAVSPEPSLLAHTSSESRGTFRQKARSLAPLNGWACAVKICHDGMLEDTNSFDGAHLLSGKLFCFCWVTVSFGYQKRKDRGREFIYTEKMCWICTQRFKQKKYYKSTMNSPFWCASSPPNLAPEPICGVVHIC